MYNQKYEETIKYVLCRRNFIINVIVSDDYKKIKSVLKHLERGSHGQVLKFSKGNFDEKIPPASFLADPSHQVKAVSNHVFVILIDDKVYRC